MKITRSIPPLLLLALFTSCASGPEWRVEDGIDAVKIELQLDAAGDMQEIEYHVLPHTVPQAVRDAMEKLQPGGRVTGAEKEYLGNTIYWEVAKEIDGFAVEAMFHEDGTLHAEEVQIASTSVPSEVRTAAARRLEGPVSTWEEVRNHRRKLVEYHAKGSVGERHFKVVLTPAGEVKGVFREVEAEIELPVQ